VAWIICNSVVGCVGWFIFVIPFFDKNSANEQLNKC
jgi:hypothetical protein